VRILVTGGAGYIGSHAVKYISSLNHHVVVVDNLSTGHRDSISDKIPFYEFSIHNEDKLVQVLQDEKIEAVIHFAAFSLVGESVKDPLKYFYNNVEGTRILVKAMLKAHVYHMIFSSSAAVYGEQAIQPIDENAFLNPSSPYGETKRVMESMLSAVSKVTPMRYVALRYFNVAGSSFDTTIGERHNPETHLVPNLIKSTLNLQNTFTLFGTNHDTKDGTAIRDYIHVEDLVRAHMLALSYLMKTNQSNVFNLGTEKGYSVKEILEMTEKITNMKINVSIQDKREGDPAVLIASYQKAHQILNWKPTHTLESIIESAYRFFQKEDHHD